MLFKCCQLCFWDFPKQWLANWAIALANLSVALSNSAIAEWVWGGGDGRLRHPDNSPRSANLPIVSLGGQDHTSSTHMQINLTWLWRFFLWNFLTLSTDSAPAIAALCRNSEIVKLNLYQIKHFLSSEIVPKLEIHQFYLGLRLEISKWKFPSQQYRFYLLSSLVDLKSAVRHYQHIMQDTLCATVSVLSNVLSIGDFNRQNYFLKQTSHI